ncbi:hypothetical protein F5887DRAFT_145756 [Amanita rubescens]|nr:hypothetical protein F5887DRAFT_1232029 [Amanita rubescens]KAF8346003.1 hypothetical protein F5887DRAFT_145756 [Amanita rubescens]
MDATYLRQLRRAELQKIAKDNNVKANLKSEVIIDVLLERFSLLKKSEVRDRAAAGLEINGAPEALPYSTSRPPATEPGNQTLPDFDKDSEADESVEAEPARRTSAAPSGETHVRWNADAAVEPTHDPRHDIYYPDSPPDYSKREDLPADENLVKETVEMIAVIDRDNQTIMERIIKLRAAAAELRSRAKAVRAVIRGEDLNRTRIMTYLTYWQPINDNWSFHEVWSGKIKIRHPDDLAGVTTSDEEDMEEVEDEQNAVDPQPNPPEHADENAVANPENGFVNENAVQLSNSPTNMDPAMRDLMGSSSIVVGQKRLREDEDIVEDADLDDRRYTPRHRRTQDHEPQTPERESRTVKAELLEQLDRLSPPPTPTPGRADKGKGRMTAEQVENLEMERAVERERFLEEIAAEDLWPGPVAQQQVNLGEVREQGASTSKQGVQTNPKPLWLDMGDPTYVPEPFVGLPTSNSGVHPHNGVPHLGLGTSPAFSSASQQPRPTRRSTRKRMA